MICKLKSLSGDTLIQIDYLKQMASKKKVYLQWYFRLICFFNLIGTLFGSVSFFFDFFCEIICPNFHYSIYIFLINVLCRFLAEYYRGKYCLWMVSVEFGRNRFGRHKGN